MTVSILTYMAVAAVNWVGEPLSCYGMFFFFVGKAIKLSPNRHDVSAVFGCGCEVILAQS